MLEIFTGFPPFHSIYDSRYHMFLLFGGIGVWMVLCVTLFAGLRGVRREFN